jgi:hypothetical protein
MESLPVIELPHPNPPLVKGRELDFPVSPLYKGRELDFPVSPLVKGGLRGVRGDLKVPKITVKHFSNNL